MEKSREQLPSPRSVGSVRGSGAPGSPSGIMARMDDEVLGYKDLAAIPRDKAILDIERPDLMIYEPHFTYSLLDREPSLSPSSLSPPPSPEVKGDWAETKSPGSTAQATGRRPGSRGRSGVQHFHHPETSTVEMNIYKKPPIYRQREAAMAPTPEGKRPIEGLIIESSKFPAAQPPDPSQPAKIETDYWPCPPSLAVVETEWRRQKASKRGEDEDEDEDSEETKTLRELQEQELSKVASNLGKLILKEEMEKTLPVRRKTRSLPDRTPFHTSLHGGSSKSASLPASGRSTLARVREHVLCPGNTGRLCQAPGRLTHKPPSGEDILAFRFPDFHFQIGSCSWLSTEGGREGGDGGWMEGRPPAFKGSRACPGERLPFLSNRPSLPLRSCLFGRLEQIQGSLRQSRLAESILAPIPPARFAFSKSVGSLPAVAAPPQAPGSGASGSGPPGKAAASQRPTAGLVRGPPRRRQAKARRLSPALFFSSRSCSRPSSARPAAKEVVQVCRTASEGAWTEGAPSPACWSKRFTRTRC